MIPKVNLPEGRSGEWAVEHFVVTEEDARLDRLMSKGGRCTPAGSYTRIRRDGQTIMSDTPDEIGDHYGAVRYASAHCLVLGLGLGMVIAAMLEKPNVTKVTVIELSPDVIALVGPTLQARYGDRLEIIEADALGWKAPPDAHYKLVWADIWDYITADNLPEMGRIKRRYGRKADLVGQWAERECRRQQARLPEWIKREERKERAEARAEKAKAKGLKGALCAVNA